MKRKILVFAPVLALMLSGCFARIPLDPSGTSGTSGKTSGSTSTSSITPSEDTYGTLDNPITVANALEIAAALDGKFAEDVFADKDAYVKGIVKAAVSEESGKYTFSAADTYGTSSSIKFYEGSVASGVTVPVEGDEVVMFGRIDNYNNGSYLLSGSSEKGIANPDVKKSAHVECTMTTSVVGQGTINGVPAKANTGTKVEFTVTPQSGFKTKSVEVNGVPANEESGKYSFVVVTNTTIVATFVETVKVTGVKLNKNEMTLNLGQDETLTATVEPSTADNKNVTWSIKDNSAAITVDQNGKVHAAQVGTGTVVVTTEDGGKTAECVVTVNPIYVSKVTLNKSSVVLAVGEDDTLTATVEPNDATLQTVTWSVEDVSPEGCVTIDAETGKVTAVAVGTAKVYATANDAHLVKSEACNVEVKSSVVHVESVVLNFENIELEAEDTSDALVATITPENADNKNVSWSLVDVEPEDCVIWNEANHTVTAVAVGSAKVVVTTEDGDLTDECVVTVSPTLVQNVEIENAPTEPLEVGNEVQLNAVVTPEKATVKDVTWASDHTEYVTVDSTGKIKAVGVGSANISATAKDGSGEFDSVTVTVKETKVSSIKLNKTSTSLTVGGTETLSVAEILPANATDKTYTWHSGDETIATVSATGLVTAVKAGEVTIEARANDGSGVHGDCVVTVNDSPTPGTRGTLDNPLTVAEARAIAVDLNNTTANTTVYDTVDAYVQGVVKGDPEESTKTAGTYRFYFADTIDGSSDMSFYWGTLDTGVELPIKGESVVIFGRLADFFNKDGTKHTYEMAGNGSDIAAPKIMKVIPVTPTSVDISSTASKVVVGSSIELKGVIGPTGARGTISWDITAGSSYATLSGSTLTGVAAGTVTVKATVTGTSVTATKDIVVSSEAPTEAYRLVTDVSTLEDGDKIVISNKAMDYGMKLYDSGNNCKATAIVTSNQTISELGEAGEFVLEAATDGCFYIKSGTQYLYAASSSGNQLKAKNSKDSTNGVWEFTYNDSGEVMSIVAKGSSNRNVMQYNYNNGSPLFNCYATASQTGLQLFRYC